MSQKAYKILSKIFKVFAIVWVCLFGIVIILSIVGFFLTAPSFIAGWQKVTEVFSPFNIANFIVIIVSLSPALIAYKLHEYFEKKLLKKTIKNNFILNVYSPKFRLHFINNKEVAILQTHLMKKSF